MSLLSPNHQKIYNFILMFVPNHSDADDIMQETSIVMFEKFNSFQKGSDFLAWARVIAKYQVLNFLKKRRREKVVFSPEMIDLIEQESRERVEKQDDWIDILRKCVSLLPRADRQLIKIRYYEELGVKVIANRFGCSFQKIYRNMSRIHNSLLRCVRRTLTAGDS